MSEFDLHILGGGPAGMASGYYAFNKNLSFQIYEASENIGGNCKTLRFNEFKFDTGAHRFHDKIPHITAEIKKILGDDLIEVSVPSKIFWNQQFLNFPIRISDIIMKFDYQTIISIILERIKSKLIINNEINNFKDLAYSMYGKTLSELFLINYTEKLWGLYPDRLSPKISGNRIRNLNFSSLIKMYLLNRNSRTKHLDGSFLYPKHGYGTIFNSISDLVGVENINLNSTITKIKHNNYKLENIMINNNQVINTKKIVSTLPINILIKLLDPRPPEHIIELIDKINYRSLQLCVIKLDKPNFSQNASIYFPDSSLPFTRIYEPKNRSEVMAPENQTCIVVEVPYRQSNEYKDIDHNLIFDSIVSNLNRMKLINYKDIIEYKVVNMPYAYPILQTDTSKKLDKVYNYLNQYKNLYCIGRNAQFEYLHLHDIFELARKKINLILNYNT